VYEPDSGKHGHHSTLRVRSQVFPVGENQGDGYADDGDGSNDLHQ
jgi:hypothetical protein